MKRFLLSLLLIVASVSYSLAQNAVVTQTYPATAYISSNTIVSTNTFQTALDASTTQTGRSDCLIQNNGAATMYIYFGAPASAITTSSLQLTAGSIFRCANSGINIRNQISITGTAGQRYLTIKE